MSRVPYDLEAEESLLGSMMMSRDARTVALGIVDADDFYKPAHAVTFSALAEMAARGSPVDQVLLAAEIDAVGKLDVVGKADLIRIEAQTPASANAVEYARIIVDASTRRSLIKAGAAISEMAYDTGLDLAAISTRAVEMIDRAGSGTAGAPDPNVVEWIDAGISEKVEFVIPGLLGRGERLLIVAGEGRGKSSMLRQFAVTLSGAIHPFRHYPLDSPRRVLLFDFENPSRLARKKLAEMIDRLLTLDNPTQLFEPDYFRPIMREEGLDLTSRADQRWLDERVDANARAMGGLDLVCIGPVYQMDPEAEEQAGALRILRALNRIRARHGCAIVMEAHAPHESFTPRQSGGAPRLRPAGSRLWIRAPEFVRAIEDTVGMAGYADFYNVRPGRDERPWPNQLRKGGRWPWTEEIGPDVGPDETY